MDADALNAIVSLGGCSASFVSPEGLGRNQSSLRVRIHPIPQQGGLGLSHRRLSGEEPWVKNCPRRQAAESM
ncbi:hypothetical protein NKH84_30880 [Mesorhizobium sp. M0902]|uniref:hypothetical protein n=1 Tax=unclassified Mesorhizobium TaxID=325217 RepID=UPI003338D96E